MAAGNRRAWEMDKVKDGDGGAPQGAAPRSVLKLKAPSLRAKAPDAAVTPRREVVTPAREGAPHGRDNFPQPRDSGSWADVYKKKMQADMDALGFGTEPVTPKPPRR